MSARLPSIFWSLAASALLGAAPALWGQEDSGRALAPASIGRDSVGVRAFPDRQVDAARGPDPQVAGAILEDGLHDVVADTVRIRGVVEVTREALGSAIEDIETAARGDPQVPGAILVEILDDVAAQTVRVRRIAVIGNEAIAVIAVEAVVGAEPQEAGPVLQHRLHALIREPLLDGEVRELGVRAQGRIDRRSRGALWAMWRNTQHEKEQRAARTPAGRFGTPTALVDSRSGFHSNLHDSHDQARSSGCSSYAPFAVRQGQDQVRRAGIRGRNAWHGC